MKLLNRKFLASVMFICCILMASWHSNAQTKKITPGSTSYKKMNGVEYKVIKAAGGKKPVDGDIAELNIRLKVTNYKNKDTTVGESMVQNNGKPVPVQIKAGKRYDWTSVIKLLGKGDSAIIRESVDTIIATSSGQQLPAFLQPGDYVVYEVKVVNIKSDAEYKMEMEGNTKKQVATDDKLIKDYLKKNNLNATKTASGLYYYISKEGTGSQIENGQTAKVMYKGKTLDGNVFDCNTEQSCGHTDPIAVKVGAHQVIQGWDEGLALLKKGTKATFLIPSGMAYGPRGQAKIPANSVLIFDVEIFDVTAE